jgi:thiol-disulfide isomerase/thioredoxin
MNRKSFATLAAAASLLIATGPRGAAQTAPTAIPAPVAAAPSDVKTQLEALVQKVNAKLQTGAHTEDALAPELKEFDNILAAHPGEKSDDLALVAFMKAKLYSQVFNEPGKALPILQQLVKDFPDTATTKQVILILPQIEAAAAGKASPTVAAPPSEVITQMQALILKINAKMEAGDDSEDDLAPELKGFDDLLAAHKGEKTDDLAQVLAMKGELYHEIFQKDDQYLAILEQVVSDYPATALAKQITTMLPQIEAEIAADAPAAAIRAKLVVGAAFPDFAVKDLDGKPLSVANYKGKVVLVDFWATWCGPCLKEMPNVIAAYNKYHEKGFEIIGISLDDDADHGRDQVTAFIKDNKMPWPQYYDGKHWETELAVKYGVHEIPGSYLLDGAGKIIAVFPHGPKLAPAIEKALATLAPAAKPAN